MKAQFRNMAFPFMIRRGIEVFKSGQYGEGWSGRTAAGIACVDGTLLFRFAIHGFKQISMHTI